MPWADLSEGLSGLKQWSEPVIYDRLIAAYRKLISDHELARNLTASTPGSGAPSSAATWRNLRTCARP
jgi:hypothetical protein